MLNLGSPEPASGSVREMSCKPNLHSFMRETMLSILTPPEPANSREHLAVNPQSNTANTSASKIGPYLSSKGQLMKTLLLYRLEDPNARS